MSIVEIGQEVLQQGGLSSLFSRGASAVVVNCAEVMRRIWKDMMEDGREVMPWEASLTDMARNYHGTGSIATSLGDMFYMQPGAHGYFARKIEISRSASGGMLKVMPPSFRQGAGEYRTPDSILSACCGLVDGIAAAFVPGGQCVPSYRVAVHRLKYHSDLADYHRLAAVTENSLGRWGQIGARVDVHRRALASALKARGLSDALAWMMVAPALRPVITAISRTIARHDRRDDRLHSEWIVEGPHIDNRLFTGLSGDRENVRTEIFDDGRWRPLPLSRDTVAIIPGARAEHHWDVRATIHRVVLEPGHCSSVERRTTNSTILIGAVCP